MTLVTQTHSHHICWITLNRPEKNNAFDERMIQQLTRAIQTAIENDAVHVLVLTGEGRHFSAGADLAWMQRMATAGEAENEKDAFELAKLLQLLYHCPKPTLVQIQGVAYGGALGLIAACDIAIAAADAQFCFSEVKLGLMPAVISPYVIRAIGPRAAKRWFITGEAFSAEQAEQIQLIHRTVEPLTLSSEMAELAQLVAKLPVEAVKACKTLVDASIYPPIDEKVMKQNAKLIATRRASSEAQMLMKAFLKLKS